MYHHIHHSSVHRFITFVPARRFLIPTFLYGAIIAVCVGAWILSTPTFGRVQYTIDGGPTKDGKLPLAFLSAGEHIVVNVPITLSPLSITSIHIRPDNCLEELQIDDATVHIPEIPFCDHIRGKTVDLGRVLTPGTHAVRLLIRDHGGMGGVHLALSQFHPILILILILGITSTLLYGMTIIRTLTVAPTTRAMGYVFLLGISLRLVYFLATPYTIRGHDAESHIEYVRYVLEHWSLPDPTQGWEFYQPPLYYFLGAGWVKAMDLIGLPITQPIALQSLSFLLSITTFVMGFWIARLLFPAPVHHRLRLLFIAVLAVFPSLIYLTARINNDTLLLTLSILWFALLLRWWLQKRWWDWYLLCVTLALGILTKGNAFLLLLPSLVSLVCMKQLSILKRCERTAASLFLILILTSWFHLPNLLAQRRIDLFLVRNLVTLHSGLRVKNEPAHLLTFNPIQVLRHPYNNPWDDAERRQFLWEYFFRSAFFGEFQFASALRDLSIIILLLALSLLPLPVIALWKNRLRLRGHLPLWSTCMTVILGAAGGRLLSPYATTQDFRYSTLLVLPFTALVISSIDLLPRFFRWIGESLLVLFIVANIVFIGSLWFFP